MVWELGEALLAKSPRHTPVQQGFHLICRVFSCLRSRWRWRGCVVIVVFLRFVICPHCFLSRLRDVSALLDADGGTAACISRVKRPVQGPGELP